MVFKGSVNNSMVVLTEMIDKSGDSVIVAIHMNRRQDRVLVNRIASIYGKNRVENYVESNINAGNLLYASKTKAPDWFTSRGLQLPKLVQTITDADNSITQSAATVNSLDKNNSGNWHSDRDTESVSNRSLLAGALESVVKNDDERSRLTEYKKNIERMDAEQARLSELRTQIKEFSFSKGKRDMAKIKALRDEATKTANRIDTYDKRLLRLESTTVLKNILDRERKRAYDKAKARGKEALDEYRAKAKERQKSYRQIPGQV